MADKKPVIGFQCPQCGSFSVVEKEERGLKSLFDWEDIVMWEGTYLKCLKCGWRQLIKR